MKIQKGLINLLFLALFSCNTNISTINSSNNETVKVFRVNNYGAELNFKININPFNIKANSSGDVSKKVSDIDHLKVYLLKNKSLDSYPSNGNPDLDKISDTFILKDLNKESLKISGVSSSDGEAYYIAIRAIDKEGNDLIESNPNITSQNKNYSISNGKGIVVDSDLKIKNNDIFEIFLNLKKPIGAKLDSNININPIFGEVNNFSTFQISTSNGSRDVSIDNVGNFVLVWTDPKDGVGYGIFGQRFSKSGEKSGNEFQVNTYTNGGQFNTQLEMDSNGNFVVIWNSNTQDGSGNGIFGQRFSKTGEKSGNEFQVNTYTTGNQENYQLEVNSDGSFVVVWDSLNQDGSGNGIFGQRFSKTGEKSGNEFQVNTYDIGHQYSPQLEINSEGWFIVVWNSYTLDSGKSELFGQKFDKEGKKSGDEFQVNNYTNRRQFNTQLEMDSDGNFVVVWNSLQHDHSSIIFSQRFDKTGAKLGNEFKVNTYTGNEFKPQLEMNNEGNFVVSWSSNNQYDSDYGVFGQKFGKDGEKLGTEFHIITYKYGFNGSYKLEMDGEGNFVVVWNNNYDQPGIFGQRFSKD